jgi:HAMP domain-containing protein
MSLRRKTLVIVGATLVGLIVIVFAISESIFLRNADHQGQITLFSLLSLLLGAGLVFGVVVLLLLEKLVLSPLSRLSVGVRNLSRTGTLSAQVPMTGGAELSGLAGEINKMLRALERSYDEIRESE